VADFPPCDDTCGALEEHVRRVFAGQPVTAVTWEGGPVRQLNPHFRVLRVGPVTEPGLWQYISVGGWAATGAGDWGLEFILSTLAATSRAVELLAMVVHYHRGGRLGLGHTVPIGSPGCRAPPAIICSFRGRIRLGRTWRPARWVTGTSISGGCCRSPGLSAISRRPMAWRRWKAGSSGRGWITGTSAAGQWPDARTGQVVIVMACLVKGRVGVPVAGPAARRRAGR